MTITDIVSIAEVVGALATLLTLWWAIHIWRVGRRRDLYDVFREQLSSYRANLVVFEELNPSLYSVEIGNGCAEHALKFSHAASVEDFHEFLKEFDRTEFYLGSVVAGYSKSSILSQLSTSLSEMGGVSGRFSESFPVLNAFVDTCTRYLQRTINTSGTFSTVNRFVKEMDEIDIIPNLEDKLKKKSNMGSVYSDLSDFFTSVALTASSSSMSPNENVREMLKIVCNFYLLRSDEELLVISRKEKSAHSNINYNNDTFTADILSTSEFFSSIMPTNLWTAFVKNRSLYINYYERK